MYKLTVFRKIFSLKLGKIAVVPLVGTWIEITVKAILERGAEVVPLVGTWIEISTYKHWLSGLMVVPLVGTWIEINYRINGYRNMLSFPSWERGLKCA